MIIAVDIGNTNINIGCFQGKRLIFQSCIDNKSVIQQTITSPIKSSFLNSAENILIASVNPKAEKYFYKCLRERYKKKMLKIGSDVKPKILILVEKQEKVGVDRLLNALAAFKRTKTSTIVIDFGTAITIDVVSKKGEFLGGVILPGTKTSAYALNKRTAFLQEVKIKKPTNVIGKNTEEAISAGIYLGTVGSVTHILGEIRKKYKGIACVVATGGDAKIFKKDISQINKVVPNLTLEGIRIVFEEGA